MAGMPGAVTAAMANAVCVEPPFTMEIVNDVQALIDRGISTGEKGTCAEHIYEILTKHKIGWPNQQIQANHMGVHPDNRSTHGVGGGESQLQGNRVLAERFLSEKTHRLGCVSKGATTV